MDDKTGRQDQFNWRLPLYAAVGALILFVPIMIYGIDLVEIAYIFIAGPVISLVLIVVSIFKKGRRLAVLSMLAAYWIVSLGLFINSRELHWTVRWLVGSKQYKAELQKQPAAANGELRHIEWDGWGFGGNDTTAYLVFDPTNSLSAAADSRGSSGKFGGIPCDKVASIRRLESQYYTVLFFTDYEWSRCK
jgi:hypothetical protein